MCGILLPLSMGAQEVEQKPVKMYLLGSCVYNGDTIPCIQLPSVFIYKPLAFKNQREYRNYQRLIRDVKKTLPLAVEVRDVIIETYYCLQAMPTEKEKKAHIKRIEKALKEQYTPKMKKLSLRQGKLLIKLVDRECAQSSYELVKLFMGSFKAGFYQTFASLFGASLKKEYDPTGEDRLVERVVTLVERGEI